MTDTPKRQSAERLCEQIHGNGVKHNSTCACPILGPALDAEYAAGEEAGVSSVTSIRCVERKHYLIAPLNRSESGSGECGACVRDEAYAAGVKSGRVRFLEEIDKLTEQIIEERKENKRLCEHAYELGRFEVVTEAYAAGVEAGRREGLRAAIAKMMIRAGAALEGRRLSEYECNDSRFIRSRAFTVAVEAIERLLAEGPEKEGE